MSFCETADPARATCVPGRAPLGHSAGGRDRTEGPVRSGEAGCLPFSGGPVQRRTPGPGLSAFRAPPKNPPPSNPPPDHAPPDHAPPDHAPPNRPVGDGPDRRRRRPSGGQGRRRVPRTRPDRRVCVIADRRRGNWPNPPDAVIVAPGAIRCTGPRRGTILAPETLSDLRFGGRAGHPPFSTATTGVAFVIFNRKGVQQP